MGKREQKDQLIDAHVSASQCKKAIAALVKHATKIAKHKEETELLSGKDENVWLVVSVKKVTPEKKLKPYKIPLAHPIVDPRANPICLITKDPQRQYKDLLEAHNIKFINRVVGVEKLKGKFKPFEARRMLLKENGLFLADERVVPLLPGLLGKAFFKAKKQPIPVSLTKKDLKKELEQAASSTYMHQNQGTCTSIKVGTISQSPERILENLETALPEIVKRIHDRWDNVQSLHIKTNSSVSLPIWTCILGEGEGGRWSESIGDKVQAPSSGDGEVSDSEDEVAPKDDSKRSKKRAADDDNVPASKKAKKTVETKAGLQESRSDTVKPLPVLLTAKAVSKSDSEKPLPTAKKDKKRHRGTAIITPAVEEPSSKDAKDTPSKKPASEPTPTKEDIKKKRLREGLEKKKEKIAKKRVGRSIKESLVGMKSKQRI